VSPEPLRIGVFGSASNHQARASEVLAGQLGQAIARRGLIVVTGATSGLPHIATRSALEAGGVALGVSPARNAREHVEEYGKPLDGCTHIFYTGLGLSGRNLLNIRNCDLAAFVGGEAGTLQEFAIAVNEGLVVGALTNSGGICEKLPDIAKGFRTDYGGAFCFGTDPETLLDDMLEAHHRLQGPAPKKNS